MRYILIMTEGSDELAFINVLLNKGILKYKREELLYEEPHHKRQIDYDLESKINNLPIDDEVVIYRVGDKLSDILRIKNTILKKRIKEIYKICTLPEFEILMIINENLYKDYIKSKEKPSIYYKKYNPKYNKQSSFVEKYFNSLSTTEIYDLINEYVRLKGKTHNKDQNNLLFILK